MGTRSANLFRRAKLEWKPHNFLALLKRIKNSIHTHKHTTHTETERNKVGQTEGMRERRIFGQIVDVAREKSSTCPNGRGVAACAENPESENTSETM